MNSEKTAMLCMVAFVAVIAWWTKPVPAPPPHDPCVCCEDRLDVFNEGMALGWSNGVAMFKRGNMQYAVSPEYDVLDNPKLHNPPLENVRAWAEYYRLIGCKEQGPPAPEDGERLKRMGG